MEKIGGKMKELKFGFIGTGTMGRQHIALLRDHYQDEAVVAAVCDTAPGELAMARELVPSARPHSDYREMLDKEGLDGVFISTPNFTHAEIAIASARSGLHVFCEKPVATTKDDCLKMAEAAAETEKLMMIGHELRYSEYFLTIKQLLDEGALGIPRMVWCKEFRWPFLPKIENWILDSRRSGGTLVDKNCHHFDLMNWYTGSRPLRVFGMGGREVLEVIGGEHEGLDHAIVSVEYQNRVKACLLLCMFAPSNTEDRFEFGVVGDKGMLKTRLSSNEILVWQRERDEDVEYDKNRMRVLKKEVDSLTTHKIAPRRKEWHGHHGFCEEHGVFISAIRGGEQTRTEVGKCLSETLISIAAEESIREGGKVVEVGEWLRGTVFA